MGTCRAVSHQDKNRAVEETVRMAEFQQDSADDSVTCTIVIIDPQSMQHAMCIYRN